MYLREVIEFLENNVTDNKGNQMCLVNVPVLPIWTNGVMDQKETGWYRPIAAHRLTLIPFPIVLVEDLLRYFRDMDLTPKSHGENKTLTELTPVFKSAWRTKPEVEDLYQSVARLTIEELEVGLKTFEEVQTLIGTPENYLKDFKQVPYYIRDPFIPDGTGHQIHYLTVPKKYYDTLYEKAKTAYLREVMGFLNHLAEYN